LQQRASPQKGTELFGAVVAIEESRESAEADAVAAGKDNTPTAR
jgi:hypothetical protein